LKRGRSGPLQESDPVSQTSGFADITSFALKAELKREISDWLSVCQKWRESHAERKKDTLCFVSDLRKSKKPFL